MHNLAVMEDAAHAWGSQWQGRGAGTIGQCGTFSFQVSKNITAGEGGILVTDDEELADLCRSFSHCGRTKGGNWYDHEVLGSNLRITEFQAALLSIAIGAARSTSSPTGTKRGLARRGADERAGNSACSRPRREMTRRSYHMYVFRVDEAQLEHHAQKFLEALQAEGVPASEGWYQPLYRNGVFTNANRLPPHGIRAPLSGMGVDYTGVVLPGVRTGVSRRGLDSAKRIVGRGAADSRAWRRPSAKWLMVSSTLNSEDQLKMSAIIRDYRPGDEEAAYTSFASRPAIMATTASRSTATTLTHSGGFSLGPT